MESETGASAANDVVDAAPADTGTVGLVVAVVVLVEI